jgi:predicted SnoaL-like aldol condensation-catalyzing enzyme
VDYAKYIQAFNSGDDARLVREFFTDDVIFQSGPRLMHGADKLLEFLHWAHDGIREIIRAQTVLRDETHIFAEIDMDFHATRDKPDFVFGALRKGEFTTVKFMVLYLLRDGKVCHLKASTWPPNVGVTKPTPRLGGSLEQRQAFNDYTRAFSNAEFDRFSAYYTDDVTCELGAFTLKGRDGIVDFYRKMFKTVRETLTVHQIVADDDGIAADITTQFTATEDAPDFVVGPLKKGQFIRGRVFVHYKLRDGKIAAIKVARASDMVTSPAPA